MFEVVGFYKFIKISYLKKNQRVLLEALNKKKVKGTIIISKEGVNGTVSGKSIDIKFNELTKKFPNLDANIIAIIRGDKSFIPKKTDLVQENYLAVFDDGSKIQLRFELMADLDNTNPVKVYSYDNIINFIHSI